MNRINVDISEEVVSIPSDLKSIIKKLLAKKSYYNSGLIDEIDNDSLELSDYHKLLVDLVDSFKQVVDMYEESECLPTLEKDMYEKVEKICEKYYSFFRYEYNDYCCRYYYDNKDIISKLTEIVRDYYTASTYQEEMYRYRELKNYYFECISNMEFFMSEEQIEQFKNKYNEALSKRDTDTMLKLIKDVQRLTLNDWYNFFDNLDNMNDNNFCFIGHSVRNNSIDGEFKSKYVSCSLFNKDLTDTYNCPYGFIMGPQNIVAADSRDMYINNDALDNESLTLASYLPKIRHPKRIIHDCVDSKRMALDEDNTFDSDIYSEVVLNKFEPKGIFCFVNGEKEIDYFYNQALELQKKFPNLKIKTINRLNIKSEFDNVKYKMKFLDNLEKYIGKELYNNDENHIYRYDMFFKEYEEILKRKDHSLDDVVEALNKNLKLLEYFNNTPDVLFNGMYNDDEIKYILGNNINYDINSLLKKDMITPYSINKLVVLLPYKDKLNKYYDGLEELVIMLSKVTVTDKMIEEIKNIDNISLISIAKFLTQNLSDKITEQKEQTNIMIKKNQAEFNELLKEKDIREEQKNKYDYYKSLIQRECMLSIIEKDLKDIDIKDNEIGINIDRLEKSFEVLNNQYEELRAKKEKGEDTTLQSLNEKHKKLSKHPFLNSRKIKKLDRKIDLYKSIIDEEINFQLKQIEIRLDLVKESLNIQKSSRQDNELGLNNIKRKIKEYFNCDTINEASYLVSEAKLYISTFDYFNNNCNLNHIYSRLEELDNCIGKNNLILNRIDNEEQLIDSIRTR